MSLGKLTTESRNPASEEIDRLSSLEIVRLMNAEDARVPEAVSQVAEQVAAAIDVVAERLRTGGRLVYIGAGTSGRLGVLDASECPPTFNTPPWQVVGLIAGGTAALTRAIEGAEDHPEQAVEDLKRIGLCAEDVLVGIATSGRTPYVIGGLQHAREVGAFAIGLSCNVDSELVAVSDLMIAPVVGPEVVSGSTRLKAGTATKLVLNMLTTGSMVKLGKTFGNLMVDLQATNQKLADRSRRIVSMLTGVTTQDAAELLERSDGDVKTAVVVQHRGVTADVARQLLVQGGGQLRRALEDAPPGSPGIAIPGSLRSHEETLILGIDGGGSKTLAWLATRDGTDSTPLGIGDAGPSNPQSVGWAAALANIDRAIQRAFAAANIERGPVAAACLAIAGAGRDADQERLRTWAKQRRIANELAVTHDAMPILAAGTRNLTGIALICGTGSLAFGRDAAGITARSGGMGYLLSDDGSGYDIARLGLRAVARAIDSHAAESLLERKLLVALGAGSRADFVREVYRRADDRQQIAALAGVVLEAAAEADREAEVIQNYAASMLAGLITAVDNRLSQTATDIALSGGVLVHSESLRNRVLDYLRPAMWNRFEHLGIVAEPVAGTIILARRALLV